MNILADECVEKSIVYRLRLDGHDVYYVSEEEPSIDDCTVLDRATQMGRLLITDDKDFGELVYREKLDHLGIVLLRLDGVSMSSKVEIVSAAIRERKDELVGAFSVISRNGIRIRAAKKNNSTPDANVLVYDANVKRKISIPRSELAHGMMLVHDVESGEDFWIDGNEVPLIESEYKHAPFTGKTKKQIRTIQQTFDEFVGLGYEEWEDGFRRDQNPNNEIGIWMRACQCINKRKSLPKAKRQLVYLILTHCMVSSSDAIFKVLPPLKPDERALAGEIVKEFYGASKK